MFDVNPREVRGASVLTAQLQQSLWSHSLTGPPGLSFLSSPALTANIYQDQAAPGVPVSLRTIQR